VVTPFSVGKEVTKSLSCTLSHRLGSRSKRILETPDMLELLVYFNGKEDKDHTLNLCFRPDVTKMKSKNVEQQVFMNCSCN
jgi:hypothetical protein